MLASAKVTEDDSDGDDDEDDDDDDDASLVVHVVDEFSAGIARSLFDGGTRCGVPPLKSSPIFCHVAGCQVERTM